MFVTIVVNIFYLNVNCLFMLVFLFTAVTFVKCIHKMSDDYRGKSIWAGIWIYVYKCCDSAPTGAPKIFLGTF